MLSSKQRAYLRSIAHELDPVFQVGKAGLTTELKEQLDDVLEARELIKVNVLKNCLDDPRQLADEAAGWLDASVVQSIGRKFLLYRPSEEEPQIELP